MCASNLLEHLEAPRFIKKMPMLSKKMNKTGLLFACTVF